MNHHHMPLSKTTIRSMVQYPFLKTFDELNIWCTGVKFTFSSYLICSVCMCSMAFAQNK